ncbi:unnamed protein product, partial [Rotaria magnacalcarata]
SACCRTASAGTRTRTSRRGTCRRTASAGTRTRTSRRGTCG